jgi:hypothetical protein
MLYHLVVLEVHALVVRRHAASSEMAPPER